MLYVSMIVQGSQLHPTLGNARIASLDVLRGVAVLGILLLNVRTFALPAAAYSSPVFGGSETPLDLAVFSIVQMLADMKFMAIFSLLFGAGLVLFTQRAESSTGQSGSIWYRRMAWLLVIGLCHAWILWWGDILVTYALCGMIVYPLRKLSVRTLALMGFGLLAVGSLIWLGAGALVQLGGPDVVDSVVASPDSVAAEMAVWRDSWWGQTPKRLGIAVALETWIFAMWLFWRCGGLMLLGMAMFRSGWLQRSASIRRPLWMVLIGLGGGLSVVAIGMAANRADGWIGVDVMFANSLWNYWGSIGVAAGWIGLVLLMCGVDVFGPIRGVLAGVGRMALSNYLAQTVICGVIFYGWGFGWHGEVGYAAQLLIVAAIWATQCIWSPLWLSRFRFGPMEWLWRSLTYWQLQPMRKRSLPSQG